MENNKTIYLREALANKKPSEILDMLPFMVCREDHYNERVTRRGDKVKEHWSRRSYEIIGVNKDSILLKTVIRSENDDDFGWSPYTYHDGYIELPLNDLETKLSTDYETGEQMCTTEYIFCHECTPKQKSFLVKYCGYDEDEVVSGYEAFHLIQEKTSEWQKQKERKKERSYSDPVLDILEGMDMQDFVESGFYFDEPF